MVGVYACRWLVEEYHKALKGGTNIEDSQLSSAERMVDVGYHCAYTEQANSPAAAESHINNRVQ